MMKTKKKKKKNDLGYKSYRGVGLVVVAFPDTIFGDNQMFRPCNLIGQFFIVEHFASDPSN